MNNKELKKKYREEQKQKTIGMMPFDVKTLKALLDNIDDQITECDHTSDITKKFCEQNNLNTQVVISWLNSHGGFCDCEILNNLDGTPAKFVGLVV
jgi:hypothetical protein